MGKVVINKFATLATMRKVGGQKEFSLKKWYVAFHAR